MEMGESSGGTHLHILPSGGTAALGRGTAPQHQKVHLWPVTQVGLKLPQMQLFPLLLGVRGDLQRSQEQDWGHPGRNEVSGSVPGREMGSLQRLSAVRFTGRLAALRGGLAPGEGEKAKFLQQKGR